MRKFPDYDSNLITLWFNWMNALAFGLVSPFESHFRGLTFPDLVPVANLFDAFVRYGNRDRLEHFDVAEIVKLPEEVIEELAMLTVNHGEMQNFARGQIRWHYDVFESLVDSLEEGDRLYQPYTLAYNQFIYAAAFHALYLPQGAVLRGNRNEDMELYREPLPAKVIPVHAERIHLRLVASNGKKLP